MKNLFKNTEFIYGVTNYKNLPEDAGSEILLAGIGGIISILVVQV